MQEEKLFSPNARKIKGSKIRELSRYNTKDKFFFAGGIPAIEQLPKQEFMDVAHAVLLDQGNAALQYGPTIGYKPLRDFLKERMEGRQMMRPQDDVIVTSGAQQALELCLKLFVDGTDTVIVENPSFSSSINSIQNYSSKVLSVTIREDGMDLDELESILQNNKIKLLYTIPTFQNPSGTTMPLAKRQRLLSLAQTYDFVIVEDDPYGELRFDGTPVPTLKALDRSGRVLYISTFSKILSPGVRVGWLAADASVIAKAELFKQMDDVHTAMLAQLFVYTYLQHNDLEQHIRVAIDCYREKCGIMLSAMHKYFPKQCRFVEPEGGIFIWCTMPEGFDSGILLQKALERDVVFVPGNAFTLETEQPCNGFRLNYSNAPVDKITEGIRRLGMALEEEMQESRGCDL